MSRRRAPVPYQWTECRHHRSGVAGPVFGLLLLIGLIGAAGGIKPSGTATPHPAPKPAPPRTVVHTVYRTVVVHPGLTSTDKMLIAVAVCVAVVLIAAFVTHAWRKVRG